MSFYFRRIGNLGLDQKWNCLDQNWEFGEIGDGSEWLVTRVRCCVAVAVRVKCECECECAWDTVRNER